ncbi:MAG: dihydroorotase [Candidatus Poseidoniaceae archaeon]
MSKGNLLVTNASIVLESEILVGDLRIQDGIIHEISTSTKIEAKEGELVVDGTGLHLMPGMIDPQVHFRDPGQPEKEDLYSGSVAAASGGITSFLDMPNNVPSITDLKGMQGKLDTAASKCITNYGFFIGATPDNVEDLQEAVGTPDKPIAIPGICGIKIFMGSSTGTLLVNGQDALETIFAGTAGLIAVHAEDETRMDERWEMHKERTDMAAHAEWRDDQTALIATKRAVDLAQRHGHRLHILHLTSGIEAEWLQGITGMPDSFESGAIITTETLPQHLTFDELDVEREGTRLKMNPPIRYAKDKELLWKGLKNGTIQCIATDHAPHTLEAKSQGFPKAPSGMPGVETSLAVMLTHAKEGTCSIFDVVNWMSAAPAALFQMQGKGKLEVGYDGDIILVDMENTAIVQDENSWSRVGWNPNRGRELTGWTQLTVVGGVPVFQRNHKTGQKGEVMVSAGEVGEALVMLPWS